MACIEPEAVGPQRLVPLDTSGCTEALRAILTDECVRPSRKRRK